MDPEGTSISVSACKDLSQCGGLSSCRESRLLPEDAGIPVMMAGSIQLAVPSQLRLCEMPPVWFMLEEEEDEDDEDEEELGSPPKLMLMLGKSALSPSCHSFTFRLSTEVLFSVIWIPPSPVL